MNTSEFLQSEAWAKLQVAAGHEAVRIGDDAYGFVHVLPLVGRYLYTPRWPADGIKNQESRIKNLLAEAEKVGAKWIRIEPETEGMKEILLRQLADQNGTVSVEKSPHDMQPRETFVIDIAKSEDELLAAMKPKTRYNIRLAEKKGVRVFATQEKKYQEAFLDLITATAERKDIVPHPRSYYEKFFTELPEEMCHLFVAEYEGVVVAANLVMIYGDTATYLHGGSGDRYREAMAPFLLQWEQIKFAKSKGCAKYDFGGVRTVNSQQSTVNGETTNYKLQTTSSWGGITRFKTGFSPKTEPTVFPGCYDIVLDKKAYCLYGKLRLIQGVLVRIRRLFGL